MKVDVHHLQDDGADAADVDKAGLSTEFSDEAQIQYLELKPTWLPVSQHATWVEHWDERGATLNTRKLFGQLEFQLKRALLENPTVNRNTVDPNVKVDNAEDFLEDGVAAAGLQVVAALLLDSLARSSALLHIHRRGDHSKDDGGDSEDSLGKHIEGWCLRNGIP